MKLGKGIENKEWGYRVGKPKGYRGADEVNVVQ